nr:hypothetical protein CFP56_49537 [Quercus suber]
MSREMTYQLKTLNLEHTCTRSYKNPRCTAKFLAKKLMKKVRRQPDIRLKDIQDTVHEKSQQNRLSILKVESELCPKVYKRLHRKKLRSSRWLACWASDTREAAEKYTDDYYRVSTYKACYEPVIDLINGQNIWTPIGLPPMQPPIKRRSPGRPKKKRAREPNEPSKGHSKGLGISKRCKSCGNIGHNKSSCKGEVGGNSSLPTAAGSGPNRRSSRPKQTSNNGYGGRASGLAINEPASIHPTRSIAATTTQSSAPSNRPANNSVATSYATTSSAPPNTSTSKMRKRSITSDTLNASRNASRSQQNRLSILKVESELCPKVYKRLHRKKLRSSRWLACWASDTRFEVKNGMVSFIVDLSKRTYSSEKYTDDYYRVSTYKACYEPVIDQINGQNIWTPIGLPPMQPPIKRRSPGRPKKKRAREPNEPSKGHSKGLGISKRCKSCGNIGHNKRSCKGEVGGNYSLPTAASSGPNRRNSRPKQTSNNGNGGRASGLAINEPASIHPTRSNAATTTPVTSSAPSNRPANNSVATSYATKSSAPPNTSTSKMRKRSITSDTLNASRNASRYREVLSANTSQASVHGPRGSASGI